MYENGNPPGGSDASVRPSRDIHEDGISAKMEMMDREIAILHESIGELLGAVDPFLRSEEPAPGLAEEAKGLPPMTSGVSARLNRQTKAVNEARFRIRSIIERFDI